LAEVTIRDTKTPNELVDANDVLLMRFGSEHNSGSPSAITFADPTIGLENFEMLHDNFAFMRPIAGLPARNGGKSTSVDGEFEVEDSFLDTSFVKAIPIALDDADDRSFDNRIGVGANYKMILELGEATVSIPMMNIGLLAADGERLSWMTEWFTILLEFENIVINVVAVVKWNVLIDRFGAPNLGWNVDNEVASCWSKRRHRRDVRIGDVSGRRLQKKWSRKIVGGRRNQENKQREGRGKREGRDIGSGSRLNCALEKAERQIIRSSSQRGPTAGASESTLVIPRPSLSQANPVISVLYA
jgi:hypothetical protein